MDEYIRSVKERFGKDPLAFMESVERGCVRCAYCGRSFDKYRDLSVHFKSVHNFSRVGEYDWVYVLRIRLREYVDEDIIIDILLDLETDEHNIRAEHSVILMDEVIRF